MSKTQKEIAFLYDLSVDADWTARFTENFDKKFKFSDEENVLYVNSGTGNHTLALHEKLGEEIGIYSVSENEDVNIIADAKAKAVNAKVVFSTNYPNENFDTVIANASFVRPRELKNFLEKIVDLSDQNVAFFLPTAGSFGEIFSVLWEVLLSDDLIEKSGEIENLINELPKISDVEEMAKSFGLSKLKTNTEIEFFEYENGKEFIESNLIEDYLLSFWLDFLDENEKEQVKEKLAQTIDASRDNMSFRFSVKATLFSGEKK
jgi:hypothetical protein